MWLQGPGVELARIDEHDDGSEQVSQQEHQQEGQALDMRASW
jgi:hypothetical protein